MSLIVQMIRALHPVIVARRKVMGPRLPSWSVQLETVAEVLRRSGTLGALVPVAIHRKVIDPPRPTTTPMRESKLKWLDIGGVRCAEVTRADTDPTKIVLYFHGGGYSTGSINSHHDLIARICEDSGMRVIFPEYRLAPENPFPAQLDDALNVYRWLVEHATDASQIVLCGDSAGGGLSVSLLYALRDAGEKLPAGTALISPWLDVNSNGPSMRDNAAYDFVGRSSLIAFAKRFAPKRKWNDPLVSPAFGDPAGLPPLLIQAGAAETLLDDSLRFAKKAKDAGVDVELEVWPDMIHVWHVFASFLGEGRQAIERIASFSKEQTSA